MRTNLAAGMEGARPLLGCLSAAQVRGVLQDTRARNRRGEDMATQGALASLGNGMGTGVRGREQTCVSPGLRRKKGLAGGPNGGFLAPLPSPGLRRSERVMREHRRPFQEARNPAFRGAVWAAQRLLDGG